MLFIGDVKYSERESSDISIIGLKTEINTLSQYLYTNSTLRNLVKWFQVQNECFLKFHSWKCVHFIDDYFSFPVAVNDKLLDRAAYNKLDSEEKKNTDSKFIYLKNKINEKKI